jgi:hypothetical protein
MNLLWPIDPLLSGDSVNSDRFWATDGKHVPVARQQILNNATVGHSDRRAVFSMWSEQRCYKQGTKLVEKSIEFCTGGFEERT